MLQALNILEPMDLKSMGYNARYIHAVTQAMHLAFADRDFYYGDPAFDPAEPTQGLLSKEYAAARAKEIDWAKNRTDIGPGDPYPFQRMTNPFADLLKAWNAPTGPGGKPQWQVSGLSGDAQAAFVETFRSGTTSIEAADEKGWFISVTPSGGWVPAVIAGTTGIGLSQRMQSFVTDASDGPFNVVEPGKRPRVTLTPTLAVKDGKPWMVFSVQGGDSQDQNLLQYFLNVVEFGMTPKNRRGREREQLSDAELVRRHKSEPGRLTVSEAPTGCARAAQDGPSSTSTTRRRGRQRHPDRSEVRHVLGRIVRLRRGLRHRLVVNLNARRRGVLAWTPGALIPQRRESRPGGPASPARGLT